MREGYTVGVFGGFHSQRAAEEQADGRLKRRGRERRDQMGYRRQQRSLDMQWALLPALVLGGGTAAWAGGVEDIRAGQVAPVVLAPVSQGLEMGIRQCNEKE